MNWARAYWGEVNRNFGGGVSGGRLVVCWPSGSGTVRPHLSDDGAGSGHRALGSRFGEAKQAGDIEGNNLTNALQKLLRGGGRPHIG